MKSKGKILFVFRDMGTGGAQKIEAFVANTMKDEGYDIVVLNLSSTPCTVAIDKNISIIDVLYDDVEKKQPKITSTLWKLIYLFRIRNEILNIKPDYVCAFLSDVVRIVVLALKGCNIPIIGSERGDPFKFSNKQFRNYKKAYMSCESVVFQLDAVKQKYNLPYYVNQTVIPNPCIPRKERFYLNKNETNHVIIGAGRLSEQKRFDILIKAFEMVYEDYPEYTLQIYGGGPLFDKLSIQIENSKAREAIKLVGDVSDVFEKANNAEFFVLSSDFEGIPNVILEAMASGLPCISTDCSPGGARFLLKNGDIGLVVPCRDVKALAEAMEKYISNSQIRKQNSEAGIKAIEEFSPSVIRQKWIAVFEMIDK